MLTRSSRLVAHVRGALHPAGQAVWGARQPVPFLSRARPQTCKRQQRQAATMTPSETPAPDSNEAAQNDNPLVYSDTHVRPMLSPCGSTATASYCAVLLGPVVPLLIRYAIAHNARNACHICRSQLHMHCWFLSAPLTCHVTVPHSQPNTIALLCASQVPGAQSTCATRCDIACAASCTLPRKHKSHIRAACQVRTHSQAHCCRMNSSRAGTRSKQSMCSQASATSCRSSIASSQLSRRACSPRGRAWWSRLSASSTASRAPGAPSATSSPSKTPPSCERPWRQCRASV